MYRISAVGCRTKYNIVNLFDRLTRKHHGCLYSNMVANKTADESQKMEKLFPRHEEFPSRHIGPRDKEQTEMLELLGFRTLDEMIDKAVPAKIRLNRDLDIQAPVGEYELICRIREIAEKNKIWRSYIDGLQQLLCTSHDHEEYL
ncbi:hypothetical protein L9F63_001834 [Diploptera punctata]|uniref:Glycine cleavage system P-protein N-terminal domain-containing protein n=1 Tax=Diploptera punctata TaxID=6984 RepID=A0AAD8A2U5_DIPPU|nr:hypothetical protein L9F63_001834 [Diploptera punctata]